MVRNSTKLQRLAAMQRERESPPNLNLYCLYCRHARHFKTTHRKHISWDRRYGTYRMCMIVLVSIWMEVTDALLRYPREERYPMLFITFRLHESLDELTFDCFIC